MKKTLTALLACAALSCAAVDAAAAASDETLVFAPGDYNAGFYRIPALTTATDGTIVAVADKRIESQADLPGKIDVVCRTSSDGGKTWSDYVTVAEHDDFGGYGDPAIVTDATTGDIIVVALHGHGLWEKTPGKISVSRSADNGRTWSAPVDINPQIMASIPEGGDSYEAWFASSGRAVQLDNGRILFSLVTRRPGVEGFPVYAVYSDDGGLTWSVSENAATFNGDEAKIVQLADGNLIMSIRNRFKGPRIFSQSFDNGESWCDPYEVPQLPDPACNGDIIRYTAGGRDLLLQTMPGDPQKRENVTVWVSDDQGATWSHRHQLVSVPSAYSSMTVLPDGRVGFLIEEEGKDGAYSLYFKAVGIDEILK